MLVKADRLHLKKLLSKAILRLCKSNFWPHSGFQIEAMIGITFGDSDVSLICINEMVTDDGETITQVHGTDCDLDTEEFEYQEPGIRSFGTAEGHHVGNESYGDVLDADKCEETRWDGGETFGHESATGCEDVKNGVGSDRHLYDNNMADDSGEHKNIALVTGSKKRKRSFATGSDQFPKKEFDREIEDVVAVKDEPGCNESDFNDTFGLECTYGSHPGKPRPPGQRVHNPEADFVSYGITSKDHFRSWPRKNKNIGLNCGQKVPGNKKALTIAAPTASSTLQSHADQRQYLDELCRGLVQDSIAQNQFYCHICNSKLSSKCALATHIKGSHIDAKLYRCVQCDLSFKWPMQLHRHRNCCHSAAAAAEGFSGQFIL